LIKFIKKKYPHLPIVAIDGAVNQLMSMGIAPNLIIGDLDSIHSCFLNICEVIKTPDQNFSDFEKSSVELQKRGFLPAIVIGIDGGRLDHIFVNACILSQHFPTSVAIGLDFCMRTLKEGHSFFHRPVGTMVSILPFPSVKLTTFGFVWDMSNKKLTIPDQFSLSNVTKDVNWSVDIKLGCAIVIETISKSLFKTYCNHMIQ
jgi:thiamine pyrophosphokinase